VVLEHPFDDALVPEGTGAEHIVSMGNHIAHQIFMRIANAQLCRTRHAEAGQTGAASVQQPLTSRCLCGTVYHV
jgi:hypothetical protein